MLVWHLLLRSEQVYPHGIVPPVARILLSSVAGLACQGHAHAEQHTVEHCSPIGLPCLANLVCHHLMRCSLGRSGLTIMILTGSCNRYSISIKMCSSNASCVMYAMTSGLCRHV